MLTKLKTVSCNSIFTLLMFQLISFIKLRLVHCLDLKKLHTSNTYLMSFMAFVVLLQIHCYCIITNIQIGFYEKVLFCFNFPIFFYIMAALNDLRDKKKRVFNFQIFFKLPVSYHSHNPAQWCRGQHSRFTVGRTLVWIPGGLFMCVICMFSLSICGFSCQELVVQESKCRRLGLVET